MKKEDDQAGLVYKYFGVFATVIAFAILAILLIAAGGKLQCSISELMAEQSVIFFIYATTMTLFSALYGIFLFRWLYKKFDIGLTTKILSLVMLISLPATVWLPYPSTDIYWSAHAISSYILCALLFVWVLLLLCDMKRQISLLKVKVVIGWLIFAGLLMLGMSTSILFDADNTQVGRIYLLYELLYISGPFILVLTLGCKDRKERK